MDNTGLPLYLILKKLNLAVVYSRENSYNLFKSFLKETRDSAESGTLTHWLPFSFLTSSIAVPFEDYNGVTSAQYNKIKERCLKQGAGAWDLKMQEWKDALIRHGDDLQALDQESAEIAGYMNKVITQQEELVRHLIFSF